MTADEPAVPGPELPGLDAEVEGLDELARGIASAWAPRALASTTLGRERALVRLFGVSGLERGGLPLAGAVVDRSSGGSTERLAEGVSLPFGMALAEYAVPAQELANAVAHGYVDLVREAELLADRDHRARAEAAVAGLVAGALERIDANRTARRELSAVLGEPPLPRLAVSLRAKDASTAAREAAALAAAGFDILQVKVPVGRELSALLEAAGVEVEEWSPDDPARHRADASDVAPAGSQRGFAAIRRAVDEAGATRRAYVRLASAAPPLTAPEQAVVAAFERVDVVVADAMTEIVASGVDPDRALADHAFAAGIHHRAGTVVLVGPGPLVVGPDMAAGRPSDPATRSGRALGLQLLGIHLATACGLPADQLVAGAVPGFLAVEPQGAARALAEVVLRRRLLPGHALWFSGDGDPGRRDPFGALAALAGILPPDGSTDIVHVATGEGGATTEVAEASAARDSIAAGLLLARSRAGGALTGIALDHARGTLGAARAALDALARVGWGSILGEEFDAPDRRRYGSGAVVERSEANDPLSTAFG